MRQPNLLNFQMLVAVGDSQLRPLEASKVSLRLKDANKLIEALLPLKLFKALLLPKASRVHPLLKVSKAHLFIKDLLPTTGVLYHQLIHLSLLSRLHLQPGVLLRR